MNFSITRERYVALGDTLWHGPEEPAIAEDTFSFGMDRICRDIEALAFESEQRLPPPERIPKPRKQEGRSTRSNVYTDAEWRRLLSEIGEL